MVASTDVDHSESTSTSSSTRSSSASNAPLPSAECMLDLNKQQWALLKETFEQLDVDGSAGLDRNEMQQLWWVLFPTSTQDEIRRVTDGIFRDIDRDGDGQVTYSELKHYLKGDHNELDCFLKRDETRYQPESSREWVRAIVEEGGPVYTKYPWIAPARKVFSTFIQVTILVSVVNMMVESLPEYQSRDREQGTVATFIVEATCIGIFTLEFLLRIFSAPSLSKFFQEAFTWIDLLAVLPFYITLAGAQSTQANVLVVLRVLRLLRLLRVLKLGRRFQGIQLLLISLQRAGDALLLTTLLVNLVAVIVFAALMFSFERSDSYFDQDIKKWVRYNDSTYSDRGQELAFQSIPHSMWWAWVTLTTVGYGDAFPRTPGGKVVASMTMVCGLVLIAFPITLLSNALQSTVQELERRKALHERRNSLTRHIRDRGQVSEQQMSNIILQRKSNVSSIRSPGCSPRITGGCSPRALELQRRLTSLEEKMDLVLDVVSKVSIKLDLDTFDNTPKRPLPPPTIANPISPPTANSHTEPF